jgi:EmrB/QacA subfamily drug resistance transporter
LNLKLTSAEQHKVVSGLQVGIFVAALDSTLVAVALLSIARDLGGTSLIAWIVAGYTVAATVAAPVYGSLSDIYGRQRMMSIAIVVYMLACIGCIFAQSMTQLLILRILQGFGGGGLLVLAQSTIGDVVPPTERGKFQAWLSGTYALAALVGPIASGYLTAWFGWRAVFAVSLPLAILALFLTRRILARLPRPKIQQRLDYLSVLWLTLGLTGLMIMLTRVGQGAGLSDPPGVLMLIGAISILIVFWQRQFKVAGPIMAPDMLRNPQVLWASLASAFVYFALIGGAVMLPLALQSIAGNSPDQVALKMLMHALAVPCGAFLSGRMLTRSMRFRRNMVFGALLSATAAAVLALLSFSSSAWVGVAMIGLGLGIGISLPPGTIAVQVAVASNRTGAVTAFINLARSLGSALGLAFLTSVLLSSLDTGGSGSAASLIRTSGAPTLALLYGFKLVFVWMAIALMLSALSASRLPAKPSDI